MLIKTLLNKSERFKSLVYTTQVMFVDGEEALVIDIVPRRNRIPVCPECNKRGKVYDLFLTGVPGPLGKTALLEGAVGAEHSR